MIRHVLLLARSVTHTAGHDAVHRLAEDVANVAGVPVRACFLDGAAPSLHEALDDAWLGGAEEIVLVPTHLPPDRYLDIWLRRAYAHWADDRAARHPGPSLPVVAVAPALVDQDALVTAIVEAVRSPAVALAGHPGPFRSPAWSTLTRHRTHVLVCRGPRCSAYGAGAVADALEHRLAERGLGDDDALLTVTGCLFPCNLGPMVVVHPDDVWYERVDADFAVRIVDEHLVGGTPVDGQPARR